MANIIHTNNNYRNVGMIEVVNEPVSNSGSVGNMLSSYYPNAFSVSPPTPKLSVLKFIATHTLM